MKSETNRIENIGFGVLKILDAYDKSFTKRSIKLWI